MCRLYIHMYSNQKKDGKVRNLEMIEEASSITWWKHISLCGDCYRQDIHVCVYIYIQIYVYIYMYIYILYIYIYIVYIYIYDMI